MLKKQCDFIKNIQSLEYNNKEMDLVGKLVH